MLNAQTVEQFTAFFNTENAKPIYAENTTFYSHFIEQCLIILEQGQQGVLSIWDKADIENADNYTELELSERYEERRNLMDFLDKAFVIPFKNMLNA
jgi:hypothetical protein